MVVGNKLIRNKLTRIHLRFIYCNLLKTSITSYTCTTILPYHKHQHRTYWSNIVPLVPTSYLSYHHRTWLHAPISYFIIRTTIVPYYSNHHRTSHITTVPDYTHEHRTSHTSIVPDYTHQHRTSHTNIVPFLLHCKRAPVIYLKHPLIVIHVPSSYLSYEHRPGFIAL